MALIGRAVARLAVSLSQPCRIFLSDYVESEAWGYDSENAYLNRGVMIVTDSPPDPFELLEITQRIEREIGDGRSHRNADGTYCDRLIDIDIIDYGGLQMNTPALILPHPRAHLRHFVTEPMRFLDSVEI